MASFLSSIQTVKSAKGTTVPKVGRWFALLAFIFVAFGVAIGLYLVQGATAEAQEGESESSEGAAPSGGGKAKASSSKGRGSREKEADGTQALNHGLEAISPIYKSQYQLNGEQLEVDPD